MGNLVDKFTGRDPNQQITSLRILNFRVFDVPQMPPKFSNRIDSRTWLELTQSCRDAVSTPDADQRIAQSQRLRCYMMTAPLCIAFGFVYAAIAGPIGGTAGNTALWVSAIIVGLLCVMGGITVSMTSIAKMDHLVQEFINDVKQRLSERLNTINHKYANRIQFNLVANNHLFSRYATANPYKRINIDINVTVLVQSVQYIESVPLQPLPQRAQFENYQPQVVPQGAQPKVVMVQMPDGRMVPAQIMDDDHMPPYNPAAAVPYNNHQPLLQEEMKAVDPYEVNDDDNDNDNVYGEGQREGEAPTKGENHWM